MSEDWKGEPEQQPQMAIPGMAFMGAGATPYDMPLMDGDTVKVRTTDESVPENFRGLKGKVIGQMWIVTVKFEDGTVQDFNRQQIKLRGREMMILPVAIPLPPKE